MLTTDEQDDVREDLKRTVEIARAIELPSLKMIDAAPYLLHELKHLVRLIEPFEDRMPFPVRATLNGARAAIKKAEGE